jgi:NAD+ synthase
MTLSGLTIAVAQLNPTVGDVAGNLALVRQARAAVPNADLLVTTELVVSGYPPEDLVLRPGFLDRIHGAVETLAGETGSGPAILLGTPWRVEGAVYNAVLLLEGGRIAEMRLKHHLPNYGVFDEKRVFAAGDLPQPVTFRGYKLGIVICEDMWLPDVAAALAQDGAQILIVPNGSPYEAGKSHLRAAYARQRVAETGLPLLYVNQVGGQDELVFDGASFVVDGDVVTPIAPAFESALVEIKFQGQTLRPHDLPIIRLPQGEEEIYGALVLGLRDYVNKNGFPGVILGLSGGIDSALAAAIAVDALGPARVRAVMMPSPYTSPESLEDADDCARLLGIPLDTISIIPGMAAMETMVQDLPGITGENIQSRLRGMTLMALSNRDGAMVLSTGNKSELAVGYATLYGDMCGGFAVLKDVYKTEVFALARWRNTQGAVMPERVITKSPSAELKPNQTDQDTLPPYDVLDAILDGLIEHQGDVAGHDPALVSRIWKMLDRAEYKRRQSPPGVKITQRAFGKERRMPITNGYGPGDEGSI